MRMTQHIASRAPINDVRTRRFNSGRFRDESRSLGCRVPGHVLSPVQLLPTQRSRSSGLVHVRRPSLMQSECPGEPERLELWRLVDDAFERALDLRVPDGGYYYYVGG